MSERTSYEPGTPCWVDLSTPDIEAAAGFYGELFGWEIPELPNSAEMGGYRRAKKNGRDVAGVYPLMEEGQHPAWASYVSVSDAEATAAAIGENGGSTIVEPMDIGMGHMAVFTDPSGAFFGIWQPGTFAGAELVNETGALGWNELETRDPARAQEFYGAVFGWGFEEPRSGPMEDYKVLTLGDSPVGGIANIAGRVPDEIPDHWMTYFWVEDADAAVEQVKAGGGEVQIGPMDIPVGRFAMVADPFGAGFAVMQPSEETRTAAP
jgi:uncharacterized protein